MILLTTPDYPPLVGGLSSHTLNVEKVLKKIGIEYELFHWKSYKDILTFPKEKILKYDFILNIHSGFHMYMPVEHPAVINFVNGAEILFYSPNFIKRLVKTFTKSRALRRFEQAKFNIFISEFTHNKMISKGLRPDYSRDLIFHMCVDVSKHKFCQKKLPDEPLKFICVARDVPHKNFAGAIKFCEKIQDISGRKVEFITVTNKNFVSEKIQINSAINPNNEVRDKLLSEAHINILFSIDNSHKGFFEGFGQIIQEAGMYGTPSLVLKSGGLQESVHHDFTGWVINDLSDFSVENWWKSLTVETYVKISEQCYQHTITSHGLDNWERLFRTLLHRNE